MKPPLLLITNDDGVRSPGIRALAAAVAPLGEVHVVAPEEEASASSQSLSLKRPLTTREIDKTVFSVEGTPADCVNHAIGHLLPRRPSLVLSGINRGANLAEDVFYSGTVGGAREATFFGVPALAISLAVREKRVDFEPAAAFAARLTELVLEEGLPRGTLLNVNVPPGNPGPVVVTVQGSRQASPEPDVPRRRDWPGDRPLIREELSDLHAVLQGMISVTPLQIDTTHHAALPALLEWEDVLRNGSGR
jgi:5'-nucleotidase